MLYISRHCPNPKVLDNDAVLLENFMSLKKNHSDEISKAVFLSFPVTVYLLKNFLFLFLELSLLQACLPPLRTHSMQNSPSGLPNA